VNLGEHDNEPIPGLPEPLPADERILWQGRPDWRGLARRAFHAPLVGAYFLLMALAAYAVMVVPVLTLGEDKPIAGIFALVGGLAYLAIGITSLVILGFLPGTKGPNKYGADPLDPTGGTAATFA